jgi:hypothetical protein
MVYNASMQKRYILIIVIVLFAASIWGLVTSIQTHTEANKEKKNIEEASVAALADPIAKDDLISIDSPLLSQKISSPVTITGKARGSWFFEGSFPVEITTEDGTIIGKGIGQANGDWMTTSYVPFSATITFTKPANSASGYIILRKDNPSGEAQFDNSVSIKVQL